jgi:hypothetical protein
MSVKEAKRRSDQSKRDREAEQDRRDQHLHDEAIYSEEALSADLLFGATAIGRYIGRPPRWVYHQQKNLGLGHIGATLIGSKTKLTKLLTGEAA